MFGCLDWLLHNNGLDLHGDFPHCFPEHFSTQIECGRVGFSASAYGCLRAFA